MKTKKILGFLCMLVICIAATKTTFAQQASASTNQVIQQIHNAQGTGNFTTKVFMASNKTYGYDIFSNGKLIYHQPAFSRVPGDNDVVITKKEQANIAAMIAIEKIKKGENPELSNNELKRITSH